ncbi:hypothetical protein [Glaciimonas sp. PAMC28666]|uniref:hypothetical protein n=1 Tax=Glaciimonas sp. PAMC28666 TaxID=2807626 RepID=UPI001965CEE8|nr:hypothetical protein [Glaciimonas sp. PAMC28666]QRX82220.1 hypothetical protein JQN73_19340 [Glaciimonas sp. PAMC28666]
MPIDVTRPLKLYRYSEKKWLERSLNLGEFRLRPASDYKNQEVDPARHDDELCRSYASPTSAVTIALVTTGQQIKPIGDVIYRSHVGTNYLTICFSDSWDELLFDDFRGTDSCLVIHNVEEFCERFHVAMASALPQGARIDGPIIYGERSSLGAIFSKPKCFISQREWRFAWRPSNSTPHIDPVIISMGSISDIAELVEKPLHGATLAQ